jgi:hypothetical protein
MQEHCRTGLYRLELRPVNTHASCLYSLCGLLIPDMRLDRQALETTS